MEDLKKKLLVVRLGDEVVGAVGVNFCDQTGVADIGPLAISVLRQVVGDCRSFPFVHLALQKQGIGSRIIRALEAEYAMTEVGVVSCRTDVLPWYDRNGYKTCWEIPLEKVEIKHVGSVGMFSVRPYHMK